MDKGFFKTKNGTFIIIALIIAISYILVEQIKINYKEKVRQETLAQEEKQKIALENCLEDAANAYFSTWNINCKSLGKKDDCGLPLDLANGIEKDKTQKEKLCMDKFKNNAFRE